VAALAVGWSYAPAAAETAYSPPMVELMSIQATIHNYMLGLEKRDTHAEASAFTEDGVLAVYHDDREVAHLEGRRAIDGAMSAGDIWDFYGNDYHEFQSSTHATHYAYWLDVHPPKAAAGESSVGQSSAIGVPGHYEDVLVKVAVNGFSSSESSMRE
jgi:hypothetical protein